MYVISSRPSANHHYLIMFILPLPPTALIASSGAKEGAAVKIKLNKEDVELIASEMLVSGAQAERCLREHKGDLKAALSYLVNC